MQKKVHLFVRGLVQGVGFRPFIYTIAVSNSLNGYVLNLGDAGVEILVEGTEENLKKFIKEIKEKKPSIAKIDDIQIEWSEATGEYSTFFIAESNEKKLTIKSVIPTDLTICDNCITDIKGKSRWHNYPFTSCAQCGPRFTIINKLPYDRKNTSMDEFHFCPFCQAEYDNPLDRRYDAQGIACPICGPKLELLDNNSKTIECEPLSEAAKLLNDGYIVALKGIGGYHIAVDANNESAVANLRKRRNRPYQPFAVMSPTIKSITTFAEVTDYEETLLTNAYHPIVTLQKSKSYSLANSVSPDLDTIGVMLPYSGIHLLLFDYFKKNALIMTSGNYPGKPISIDNSKAQTDLKKIADYFLVHNRKIINRCDDSVIKVINEIPIFLRKSRGYSPSTLKIPWTVHQNGIVAVGGDFNITGSVFLEDRLVTTQHIGDAEDIEILDYLKKSLNYIIKTYNISSFSGVACDLNPSFQTSRYAKEFAKARNIVTIPVQHHHAHMAALMADHSMPKGDPIVCIAIDGVGYGMDGMAWGGEILVGSYTSFDRVGQLRYQPLPGGDICAKYPARMLAAILSSSFSYEEICELFKGTIEKYLRYGKEELNIIFKQSHNDDVMKTSSIGRFLDAISALLGICGLRTFEGEPPMKLEAVAKQGKESNLQLRLPILQRNNKYFIDTSDFMLSIIENIKNDSKQNIAFEVHRKLGLTLGKVACTIADEYNISHIGIVGGSAVNSLLFRFINNTIIEHNKRMLFYKTVPCGDGGISIGQAVVASANMM